MKKIKILYTINFLNNGGPSKVLLNIIKALNKNEYDINVLTIIDQNNSEIIKSLRENGVNVIEVKMKKKISDVLKFKNKIYQIVNNLKPDIIHTHGIVTSILLSSKKIGGYKMTTIHSNVYEDYKYTYGNLKGPIITFLHLLSLKKFDKVVCCSKSTYDVIKDKFVNISYIRNGIDSGYEIDENIRKKIRNELSISDKDIVFIYAGVITKLKRVVELIEMFNFCHKNNENLVIVGDGPLLNEIKKYANNNVKILGYKNNILDYLSASDIYISNSSSEGLSISVIEALEQGLGLLLSDIPSHKEIFEIDSNYFIGSYFNKNDFSYKKDYVIQNLANINNTREFKQKYLSSKSMTSEYEKIYRKV